MVKALLLKYVVTEKKEIIIYMSQLKSLLYVCEWS